MRFSTMIKQSLRMEEALLYASLSVFLLAVAFIFLSSISGANRNLPPSKPALPVIGHLHLIKEPVHRTLHALTQKLGPVYSLRFGSKFAVVVSSASVAQECFTTNDVVLANRPRFIAGKYFGYDYTAVGSAPHGDHWRNIRRLMALEIFSVSRLNSFLPVRKDEIRRLLRRLYRESAAGFSKVEMRSRVSELTFNITLRMIAGKRYYGDELANEDEAREFRELVREVFEYANISNPSDFLPFCRWIDYKNYEKNVRRIQGRMDSFLQGLIEEHRRDKSGNSMIDHLLSLQESEPAYYTDQIIKGMILTMILAGTDTSAVTIEWAMSHLVNHPEILKKAKSELDAQIGQDQLIDEHHLPQLHYLQSIIYETFRLCPAAPLLLPHVPSKDCKISGFDIPRDTVIIVNAWGIHRDPNIWDEPTSFMPERFEGRGPVEEHKLLPFGMGRRSCPGAGLAQRVVGLGLGSLIQCFEWKRVAEEMVDLTEGTGLTMPKAQPLEVMCKARDILHRVLQDSNDDV